MFHLFKNAETFPSKISLIVMQFKCTVNTRSFLANHKREHLFGTIRCVLYAAHYFYYVRFLPKCYLFRELYPIHLHSSTHNSGSPYLLYFIHKTFFETATTVYVYLLHYLSSVLSLQNYPVPQGTASHIWLLNLFQRFFIKINAIGCIIQHNIS